MQIDLRSVGITVARELSGMFRRLPSALPVSAIEIVFNIDPGGYDVKIATHEGYAPGRLPGMKSLADFLHTGWCEFDSAIFSEASTLTTYAGDALQFTPMDYVAQYGIEGSRADIYRPVGEGDHFITALGCMFVDILQSLRESGAFSQWNLRSTAVFYIEECRGYVCSPLDSTATLHIR